MKDGYSVTFAAWMFRDILNVCGALAYDKNNTLMSRSRPMLKWIRVTAEHESFVAHGMNAVSCAKVEGACHIEGTDGEVVFYVLPAFKFPAGTEFVTISVYDDGETILEFKSSGNVSGREVWQQPEDEYYDVASLIKGIEDEVSKYNDGLGQYYIVVRPKELMKALHGLKNEESIILNFSDRVHGFTMRPYDSGMQAEVCMLPVRTMDDTKAGMGYKKW